jgi:hypothetical protein
MYFGSAGNYMLDDRGVGPPLPDPARFELVVDAWGGGGQAERLFVTLRGKGDGKATKVGSAQLSAATPGRPEMTLATIHRDILSLFDEDRTYVGHISVDGMKIVGTQFGPGIQKRQFTGVRILR